MAGILYKGTSVILSNFLKVMVQRGASDLFFSAGAPVGIKIEGTTAFLNDQTLTSADTRQLARSIMNDKQHAEFERELEINLALAVEGVGRFRVNVFRQTGSVAMVIRHIKTVVPSIDELNLPVNLKELVMEPRGLVLVVGSTGSVGVGALADIFGWAITFIVLASLFMLSFLFILGNRLFQLGY